MSIRHTIENNEKTRIRPTAGGHRELSLIEKDVRNYIMREVRNVLKLEDAREFGKYLLRMKEKNQNFFLQESFDKSWNDFRMKYGVGDNKWLSSNGVFSRINAFRRSSFMNFSLSRSPLLGQNEKHKKKREHACKFITRNSSLIQFIKQYNNCLGSRK
ncbi:hypothetical protein Ahy_B03g066525 [Arachis hypogaea]|uniref:Protein FAR1-RELATED SEQUENCE n=1 Tax=Arachis hypogaea TaxID=3818 RepID=A0A445A489_ARAHY|nr:hypothetical protein Ahy_B03g066525 [Arachis hypogaea]